MHSFSNIVTHLRLLKPSMWRCTDAEDNLLQHQRQGRIEFLLYSTHQDPTILVGCYVRLNSMLLSTEVSMPLRMWLMHLGPSVAAML